MARQKILHFEKLTEQKIYRSLSRNVLLKKWQTFSPCVYRIISKTLFSFTHTTSRVATAREKHANVFLNSNWNQITSALVLNL